MRFDFGRMIRYYEKVVQRAERDGRDWRYDLYVGRLERVRKLSTQDSLSRDEVSYLSARQAVAEAFG